MSQLCNKWPDIKQIKPLALQLFVICDLCFLLSKKCASTYLNHAVGGVRFETRKLKYKVRYLQIKCNWYLLSKNLRKVSEYQIVLKKILCKLDLCKRIYFDFFKAQTVIFARKNLQQFKNCLFCYVMLGCQNLSLTVFLCTDTKKKLLNLTFL